MCLIANARRSEALYRTLGSVLLALAMKPKYYFHCVFKAHVFTLHTEINGMSSIFSFHSWDGVCNNIPLHALFMPAAVATYS